MHRLLEAEQGGVGVALLQKLRQGGVRQWVSPKGDERLPLLGFPEGGGAKEVAMLALIRLSPVAGFHGLHSL